MKPAQSTRPSAESCTLASLRLHRYFLRFSFQFLHEAADPRRVDVDPRAHRAGQCNRLDVAPLRRGRLGARDLLEQGGVVLDQLALVEALLAERDVDVRAAVGAVFELARLRLLDRLRDVHRDGAGLRVRHLPARAEDPAEPADDPHLVGRADDVGTGLLGLARLLALGEDGHTRLAAGPMRKHQRPAELLLGVPDVEPEVEVHFDGLVELRGREALQHPDRLDRRVEPLAVDLRARGAVILPMLAHRSVSTPIERAVPATISIACSTSRAFRSGIFASAIRRSWSRVRRPTFSRFGSPEPFSSRSASLISTAAGGVLVMKSNERSS